MECEKKNEDTDTESIDEFSKMMSSLISDEKLDRTSPELWPEMFPGISQFVKDKGQTPEPRETIGDDKWINGLTDQDIQMITQLARLTMPQMLEKVKDFSNFSYQLGLEESKEMQRGKLLNVLERTGKRKRRLSKKNSLLSH